MKLITRDTDYAVRAICYIAKKPREVISVSELAEKLIIPRPFLRKILQTLNKQGILRSARGRGGGFSLTIPSKKLSLIDLLAAFQGPLRLNQCLFRKGACPQLNSCALKKEMDQIEKYVAQRLRSISVAGLLKKEIGNGKKKYN